MDESFTDPTSSDKPTMALIKHRDDRIWAQRSQSALPFPSNACDFWPHFPSLSSVIKNNPHWVEIGTATM